MDATIREVATIRSGYPFRSRLIHEPTGTVAVVQMKDIDDNSKLDTSQLTRTSEVDDNNWQLLQQGDLLFRARGQTNTAALVENAVGPTIAAAPLFHIRPMHVLPEYLLWFINLPATQRQLNSLAAGTSLQMISKASLETLLIPMPEKKTQKLIAETALLAQQEKNLMNRILNLRNRCTDTALLSAARIPAP